MIPGLGKAALDRAPLRSRAEEALRARARDRRRRDELVREHEGRLAQGTERADRPAGRAGHLQSSAGRPGHA